MENRELLQNYEYIKETESQTGEYKLYQNFPQSFYMVTSIGFDLPESIEVKLAVYDIYGREKLILVNKQLRSGSYEVKWSAYQMEPGIYFYKIKAGEYVDSKKMFLLKN